MLSRIEFSPAPLAAKTRSMKLQEIQDVLRLHGVDLRLVRLSGASRIKLIGQRRSTNERAGQPQYDPNRQHGKEHRRNGQVVVAVRPLRPGDIVRERDIKLVDPPSKRVPDDAFHAIDQVAGFQVTWTVSVKRPIRAADVRSPVLVRRGELVTVFARAAGVQVKSAARAMQNGSLGEIVTAESLLDRKQRFSARVVDIQEVAVYAQGMVIR